MKPAKSRREWTGRVLNRLLGEYGTNRPGPLFLVLGGMHGNEPGGVVAVRRILKNLEDRRPTMCGRLIAFVGNLAALERGERFLERDLNRIWTDTQLRRIPSLLERGEVPEAQEQCELLLMIEEILPPPPQPVFFLDLHSISAPGAPFSCIGDTLANQRFIAKIPMPSILGLQESIDGSLLEYLDNRGHIAVALEGGSHGDPETADCLESALWVALVAGKGLRKEDVPDYQEHVDRLVRGSGDLPRFLEIRYRHAISAEDRFEMRAGYCNLQPVRAGEVVASDRDGPIEVPEDGLLLLPLYQGQGEEGFFVARRYSTWKRILSAIIRVLGLRVLLSLLPGVCRHPTRANSYYVLRRTPAKVALFDLLGYRKRRSDGEGWIFSRSRNPFTL